MNPNPVNTDTCMHPYMHVYMYALTCTCMMQSNIERTTYK